MSQTPSAEYPPDRQCHTWESERPPAQIPADPTVCLDAAQRGRDQHGQPDAAVIERGAGTLSIRQPDRGREIPQESRCQSREGQQDRACATAAHEDQHQRYQDEHRRYLQRQAGCQQEPGQDQVSAPPGRLEIVPAAQPRGDRAEHQCVRLKGPAVADRDRKRGERRHTARSAAAAPSRRRHSPCTPQAASVRPNAEMSRPAGSSLKPVRRRKAATIAA